MTAHSIAVGGSRPYAVRVGVGLLEGLADEVRGRDAFVLTDTTVERLYAERLGALTAAPRLAVSPGEGSKSFPTLERVLDGIAAAGLGRDGVIVAVGGGVVSDLGGLAAALFGRGIDYVTGSTTLLAQVDASVGGKTAVNLAAGKNLAGAFHAPRAVLADVGCLATLPAPERRSGLGELAKTALIAGGELLAELEARAGSGDAQGWDESATARLVALAIEAKAAVVAADEREAGPREVLNLGHTFGHAIEHAAGFGRIPHGVAVAAGIGLAVEASRRLGLAGDGGDALRGRAGDLLRGLGLPTGLADLSAEYDLAWEPEALLAGLRTDKKRRGGVTRLVLPVEAGDVRPGVAVDEGFLRDLLSDAAA